MCNIWESAKNNRNAYISHPIRDRNVKPITTCIFKIEIWCSLELLLVMMIAQILRKIKKITILEFFRIPEALGSPIQTFFLSQN